MAPHWPEEVDVFSEPHSRMKKLVHKYSKMVSTTDFTDESHMANLLHNLINMFCEFKAHEEIENILIMRNLKRKLKAACVTSAAVCNCHSDNRLTDMLEMVVNGSRSCWTEKSVKERQKYGHKLQKALEDFTQNFLPHMEEEEEVFQPMLMQYFTYEELKELKAKVIHEHVISSKQEKYIEDLCPKTSDRKVESGPCHFDCLPDEICVKIFSYLNPQDLCHSSQTCHRWNRTTKDPSLWSGIYPVHWAAGNWTFHPEPLGGVDGAGAVDDDLMEEFDAPVSYLDEDADVDESSSQNYDDGDAKDYGSEGPSSQALGEVKIVSSLVKHLLPRVGSGVKVVDLAYSKGLNSSSVHKILKLCPNMEVLDLTHTQVGDDAFYEYGVSNRQSKLRHLDLTNCYNITDNALWSLTGASVSGLAPHALCEDGNGELEDFNEGVWQTATGMEKELDIEIIPVCCGLNENGKVCDSVGTKQGIEEEKGDGYNCCSEGLCGVKRAVIKECDKNHGDGRVVCSDKRRGCVNRGYRKSSKHVGIVPRVNNLNIECNEPATCCGGGGGGNMLMGTGDGLEMQNCCHDNDDGSVVFDLKTDKCCCGSSETSSSSAVAKNTPSLQAHVRNDCCHVSSQSDNCHAPSQSLDYSYCDSPPSQSNSMEYLAGHVNESCFTFDSRGQTEPVTHSSDPTCLPVNTLRSRPDGSSARECGSSLSATSSFPKPACLSCSSKPFNGENKNASDKEVKELSTTMKVVRTTRPLSQLQFLSLNGCYGISDVGLRILSNAGGTPRLEHLDLSGCVQLTGTSVKQLVSTCGPQLDLANLFYCDNLPVDPYPATASGCRNRGCGTRFCCSVD